MHPQQLAAMHPRGLVVRQKIEQVGGVQAVVDGAQARGLSGCQSPMLCLRQVGWVM